jgi:hypothetical protein
MNVPEMSLCLVLRDRPVSWDEETGVADHKETCHTVLILLIIKSLVKIFLNFNKLRMLRLLLASSYTA